VNDRPALRTCEALALTARAAAARWSTRRGTARGSRKTWVPVALRWRRPRPGRRWNPRACRQVPPVAGRPLSLRFSLEVRVLDRRERHERPGAGAVAREPARRICVDRAFRSHARAAAVARGSRPEIRVPLSAPGRYTPRERVRGSAPAASQTRWLTLPLRNGARVASAGRLTPVEREGNLARTNTARSELARPLAGPWRLHSRELQVFRSVRVLKEGPVSGGVEGRRPSLEGADRSPELVWRSTPGSAAGVSGGPSPADLPAPSPRAPARGLPGGEAAFEAPLRVARAVTAPVTNLDPGLWDRLADDVIRRVERRVRIERERRGL
jgi:hypothetical protein